MILCLNFAFLNANTVTIQPNTFCKFYMIARGLGPVMMYNIYRPNSIFK